jgi:hypothetical protein
MSNERWTVEDAARAIAERFIQKSEGTSVRRVERGFAGSNELLGQLERQRLASRHGTNQYFPTFYSLELVDPELRKYAENCINVVLKGLKLLYDQSESSTAFGFANVRAAVESQHSLVENEMVKLGMVLCCDFLGLIGGWSGTPGTEDFSLTPRSEILGFENVHSAWQHEMDLLKFQEERLVAVRQARIPPPVSSLPETTDFSIVHLPKLRAVIERDYAELSRIRDGVKSRMILAGGLIEALLLDALKEVEPLALAASTAPKDRTKTVRPLDEWALGSMLDVAVELKIIDVAAQKFGHGVRDYRNLVHPGLEIRSAQKVAVAEADIAEKVLGLIIRDLDDRKKKQP